MFQVLINNPKPDFEEYLPFEDFYDTKEQKNIRTPKVKKITDISAVVSSIEPEEGDLLLFPSYLYHAVEENLSNNNRIVISFNIDIDV